MEERSSPPSPQCRHGNPLENRSCGTCGASVTSSGQLARRPEGVPPAAGHWRWAWRPCQRQGELLGLKWEDVDLEGGTVQVRRTLSTATGGGFRFGPPKTAKSRRSVKLPGAALSALKKHRRAQLEERMRLAGLFADHGLVFASRAGTPVSRQDLVTRSFKPLLKRAGLPDVRFHDLRHTCATLLLGRGVHAKLVQELLGHSTISVTLDTYSHVLPGMSDAAAGAMDEALG